MGKWVDVSICMWTVDCGLCGMSNLRQVRVNANVANAQPKIGLTGGVRPPPT